MADEKFDLKLTDEQQAMLKEAFGESVQSLKLSVEDFGTDNGSGDVKLRVLRVDNVARIISSTSTMRHVLN